MIIVKLTISHIITHVMNLIGIRKEYQPNNINNARKIVPNTINKINSKIGFNHNNSS